MGLCANAEIPSILLHVKKENYVSRNSEALTAPGRVVNWGSEIVQLEREHETQALRLMLLLVVSFWVGISLFCLPKSNQVSKILLLDVIIGQLFN